MTALGGFILGSLFRSGPVTEVHNNTKVIHERPMTPTEITEHEERLKCIKENEPKIKVTLISSQEITEEDFIGLPMTKENVDRYFAWKAARARMSPKQGKEEF